MAFHQYNKFQYNTAQYNADAFFLVKSLSESIASADIRIDSPTKVLTESISSSDARIMGMVHSFSEFLFLIDFVSKSILNKGFTETIRVNDWLEIERQNQNNGNGWSN